MIPARDWLQKPKYLQIMLKSTVERIIPITNKGTAIDRRTRGLICGSLIASAMVKRAARNAVSPEVIGRITTPKIASTPPKVPNKAYEENAFNVYRYIPIKDIQILLSPTNRLTDLNEKFEVLITNY